MTKSTPSIQVGGTRAPSAPHLDPWSLPVVFIKCHCYTFIMQINKRLSFAIFALFLCLRTL